jgi:iron complex transport system ATP-binding protein
MSKGERQNVMIARALISNPEILVLDEPGNGLDVLAREYMLETVMKLAKERNITVLYVTHYVEEILPIFENAMMKLMYELPSRDDVSKVIITGDFIKGKEDAKIVLK